MTAPSFDDYRWLTSPAAERYLVPACQAVHERTTAPLVLAALLRRELTATQAALVQEQARLRVRAAAKFSAADRMFFTARSLEQSTDEWIARYKAGRFAAPFPGQRVADLCCGIGGDLAALATMQQAMGVDRDPIMALLAAANAHCDALSMDATQFDAASVAAWHIDPDRRPQGRRTTHSDLHEPSTEAIDALRAKNAHAAIKLAPAAEIALPWSDAAELEWIGHSRQCQQLVAWFGRLATSPGERRATILATPAAISPAPQSIVTPLRSFAGPANVPIAVAARIERFIAEPHAAVLAARLHGHLAAEHRLAALAASIPYFTTDTLTTALAADAALALFEVIEVLPLRVKQLKAELRRRNAGTLEIKKRGIDLDPESLRRQLATTGSEPLTLIVSPTREGTRVLLCRRLSGGAGEARSS